MLDLSDKKSWTTALILNAFVLPGTGHFLIGFKLKGVLIALLTMFFALLPLIRYAMGTVNSLQSLPLMGSAYDRGVAAFSTSWEINRNFILICVTGMLILWIYGIIDLFLIRKRRSDARMHD